MDTLFLPWKTEDSAIEKEQQAYLNVRTTTPSKSNRHNAPNPLHYPTHSNRGTEGGDAILEVYQNHALSVSLMTEEDQWHAIQLKNHSTTCSEYEIMSKTFD